MLFILSRDLLKENSNLKTLLYNKNNIIKNKNFQHTGLNEKISKGILERLQELKISTDDIDYIFITHFHGIYMLSGDLKVSACHLSILTPSQWLLNFVAQRRLVNSPVTIMLHQWPLKPLHLSL